MSWTCAQKPIEGMDHDRDREFLFLEDSVSATIPLACVRQYDS